MKQIGIRILCVLLCMVLLTACGQTPQLPDESIPQDTSVSSTTESTTTTTEETTTTTISTTTTTTTTTVETTTTTTTTAMTKGVVGTEDTPPVSFSFNWNGEEVLLTYEGVQTAFSTLSQEHSTGWTFISEDEEDVETNWRYCGKTTGGKEISSLVFPKSREILRIGQLVDDVAAGANDKEAVRDKVFEDLQKMGYTYIKEDISVRMNSRGKGSDDGYFAIVTAYNETDGGSHMYVYWTKDRGWQIGPMYLAVDNRYRKPNWK